MRESAGLYQRRTGSEIRDDRILRVLAALAEVQARPPLSSLARLVGLSESRLEHLFLAQVGSSISMVSLAYRLHLAAATLREGAVSVKTVQIDTGFRAASHFSRRFSSHFRLSPAEYKARVQQKQKLATTCCCSSNLLRLVSELRRSATVSKETGR